RTNLWIEECASACTGTIWISAELRDHTPVYSTRRADVTKVATSLCQRWDGLPVSSRCFLQACFFREKEERLVPPVIDVRNNNRSANRSTKVVATIKRGGIAHIEIPLGVEGLVAEELINIAVEM